MATINVVQSCLVPMTGARLRPRPPPPEVPKTMELTPWDLINLLYESNRAGILFDERPNQEFIDRLKNSLARTLDFFPPLSGRLGAVTHVDDGAKSYFIDCNDAGAEFTHAVARGVSVANLVEPEYMPRKVLASFFPEKETPSCEELWKPLAAVQVTELDDGFFVSCAINHVVADAISFWHFFHSWSELARGFDTISKPPVFDRWLPSNFGDEINHPIRIPPFDQNPTANATPPPPLLERVFHFSKESLAELKNKANSKSGCDEKMKISTFQALSAHLWRGVVRARHSESITHVKEPQSFILLVDARSRIPLPDGYFGNAVHRDAIEVTEHEILQNGLEFVAAKINELVGRQTREAIIKSVEDWIEKPVIPSKGSVKFLITGSPRFFDIRSCDFGCGKSVASMTGGRQKFDGKVTILPAAQDGSVDVEVCLSPETMIAMEDDVELMGAVTI
ncbi:uncharacterized acetyltransferase At3g50280-like [Andrographis paniculata]|uniref:uncharacterized acetyltransferase At3g50280-like n=1 Tax=Andrographis paniculata TaxID=175694 RepID=UPI0021E859AF|nr:uncharacterized acetyltransferase At3g50280-like [Andrographis paniculata]